MAKHEGMLPMHLRRILGSDLSDDSVVFVLYDSLIIYHPIASRIGNSLGGRSVATFDS